MGDDTSVDIHARRVRRAALLIWGLGGLLSIPAVFGDPYPAALWRLLYFTLPFAVLALRIKFLFKRADLEKTVFIHRVYGAAFALLFLVLTYFGAIYIRYAYHPLCDLVINLMPLTDTLLLPIAYLAGVGVSALELFTRGK